MNFHFVAIEDTFGNVRFLAKFDLTGQTSYKTCLNCFTIKTLYFLNINDCNLYQCVNIHPGQLPNKGRYGCAGPGIRHFRGQFLPGH